MSDATPEVYLSPEHLRQRVQELGQQITRDYIGFTVPDRFVVGYGIDYAQRYRNLPYVALMK